MENINDKFQKLNLEMNENENFISVQIPIDEFMRLTLKSINKTKEANTSNKCPCLMYKTNVFIDPVPCNKVAKSWNNKLQTHTCSSHKNRRSINRVRIRNRTVHTFCPCRVKTQFPGIFAMCDKKATVLNKRIKTFTCRKHQHRRLIDLKK